VRQHGFAVLPAATSQFKNGAASRESFQEWLKSIVIGFSLCGVRDSLGRVEVEGRGIVRRHSRFFLLLL
jgi:hypothetical protein